MPVDRAEIFLYKFPKIHVGTRIVDIEIELQLGQPLDGLQLAQACLLPAFFQKSMVVAEGCAEQVGQFRTHLVDAQKWLGFEQPSIGLQIVEPISAGRQLYLITCLPVRMQFFAFKSHGTVAVTSIIQNGRDRPLGAFDRFEEQFAAQHPVRQLAQKRHETDKPQDGVKTNQRGSCATIRNQYRKETAAQPKQNGSAPNPKTGIDRILDSPELRCRLLPLFVGSDGVVIEDVLHVNLH